MHDRFARVETRHGSSGTGYHSASVNDKFNISRVASSGDSAVLLALDRGKLTVRRFTKSQRFVEHRVEHRREVAGRGIDDLQDLGGRGLPCQRLVPLSDYLVTLGERLAKLALQLRDGVLRI